jgi:TolA-binding protein
MNMLIADYPDSSKVSEALYHVGLSCLNMGKRHEAEYAFKRIVRDFSEDIWARYSEDRLREMKGSG